MLTLFFYFLFFFTERKPSPSPPPVIPDIPDVSPSSPSLAREDSHDSKDTIPLLQDECTSPVKSQPHPENASVEFELRENSYRTEVRSPLSDIRPENGLDLDPELTSEHLRNINSLLTGNGGGVGSLPTQNRKLNTSDVQPTTGSTAVFGALSTPIVPVIIALFVCVLLSVKLEYVVSNSISLPFLLWEAHHLWCNRHSIDASSRSMGGLTGIALVLCGVQQSFIRKLTHVITVIKCVFEDFAFYILTIVIWHWTVGLPGSAIYLADELTPSETIQVTDSEEDIDTFTGMEDF